MSSCGRTTPVNASMAQPPATHHGTSRPASRYGGLERASSAAGARRCAGTRSGIVPDRYRPLRDPGGVDLATSPR